MQMEGDTHVGQAQPEEIAQQQAVISNLRATIEKLQLDKAKSDDSVKELQKRRREFEGREQAAKEIKKR